MAEKKTDENLGKKKIIADVVLISVLLVLSLSVFVIMRLSRTGGAYAVVTVDGVEVARYSLSDAGEYEINGGSNILVIEDGCAYVSYADCPDGLCKSQGKKSHSGERIVCLPNKVMIEIVGAGGGILEV